MKIFNRTRNWKVLFICVLYVSIAMLSGCDKNTTPPIQTKDLVGVYTMTLIFPHSADNTFTIESETRLNLDATYTSEGILGIDVMGIEASLNMSDEGTYELSSDQSVLYFYPTSISVNAADQATRDLFEDKPDVAEQLIALLEEEEDFRLEDLEITGDKIEGRMNADSFEEDDPRPILVFKRVNQ